MMITYNFWHEMHRIAIALSLEGLGVPSCDIIFGSLLIAIDTNRGIPLAIRCEGFLCAIYMKRQASFFLY